MISFEKALKIMRQNIKVSKKTEKINVQNSHMRIISKKFCLNLIIQEITLRNGWYCHLQNGIEEK